MAELGPGDAAAVRRAIVKTLVIDDPDVDPRRLAKAKLLADCLEEVAREHAASTGFDVDREDHGLFRAMMAALSRRDLRVEWMRRSLERARRQ
jgi:hypothetical protein